LSRERVDISLSPAGKLAVFAGGLLLLAVTVLLVAQLSILADSREHIVAQDRKINRLLKGAGPVLDEAEPLADEARGLVREARPLVRDARPLARDARPLLREARPLVREARPFLRDLHASMVPLLRELRTIEVQPLIRLVDQSNEVIDALRASEAIPRTLRAADVVPEMARLLAATLGVQQETLRVQRSSFRVNRQNRDVQRQALAILQRSLAVQEEALVHVRSIDRKTGGTAPEARPPAPGR
jgi:hypothetical protein